MIERAAAVVDVGGVIAVNQLLCLVLGWDQPDGGVGQGVLCPSPGGETLTLGHEAPGWGCQRWDGLGARCPAGVEGGLALGDVSLLLTRVSLGTSLKSSFAHSKGVLTAAEELCCFHVLYKWRSRNHRRLGLDLCMQDLLTSRQKTVIAGRGYKEP